MRIKLQLYWNIPNIVKKLEGFLGIVGYYRCFIQNFGWIVWPLTDLKSNAFKWTSTASHAFEKLKQPHTSPYPCPA